MNIKRPDDDGAADLEVLPAAEILRQIEQETELTATAMIDLSMMQRGVGLTETLKRKVRAYCDSHGVNYAAALAYLCPLAD
jgi:hypothetical protein